MQPYKQIQENAGGSFEIKDYVIDPAKAIRLAVRNAISMVATLITVGVVIPHKRELSPAEGYVELGKSLDRLMLAFKKHWGILDENDKEIMKDSMADHDDILRNGE